MKKKLLLIVTAAFLNLGVYAQSTSPGTTQNCDCNPEGWHSASVKILHSYYYTVKCGFQLEGYLKKYYRKDGKIFDGKLYALVK